MRLATYQKYIITGFGTFTALTGILYMIFWDNLYKSMLNKILTLEPNAEITNLWETPPITLTLDFYMFNWTNPDDFHNSDINPKFVEAGPYRFTEKTTKVILKWHPENASVTYRKKSTFFFDPENSKGKLSDRVSILNALTIGAIFKSRYWQSVKRSLLGMALTMYGNDITFNSTVEKLIFKGFDDNRMDLVNSLPFAIPDLEIPFDKFGFCYPRNNSEEYSGVFNMYTGADDINKLGKLHTWNNMDGIKGYPECGKIEGSTGEFQTPNLKENEGIQYYITDFCHPLKLDYSKAVDIEGVRGFEYTGGLRSFDNGTHDKSNLCFCKDGGCMPIGVMNISSCWYNFPLFISYPHFYKADPVYLQEVDGLKPDPAKHELSMTLEPDSGLLLQMKARFQLNMLIDNIEHSSLLRNVRRRLLPLVWADYRMSVGSKDLERFRMMATVKKYGRLLGLICIAIGLCSIAWCPIKKRWNKHFMRHIEINSLTIGQEDAKMHIAALPEQSPLIETLKRSHKLLIKSISRENDSQNINQNNLEAPS